MVKKVLLFASILSTICLTNLNAQTTKGKFLLGVSSTLSVAGTGSNLMTLGYSTIKHKRDVSLLGEPEPDKTISFNLIPKVGYFVIDNLALGLDLSLASTSSKDGVSGTVDSQTMFCIGPFMRYYIPKGKLLPFVEINGGMGSIKNKRDESGRPNYTSNSSLFTYGGGVGLSASISDRVAFDIMAGYSVLQVKQKENNDDNERTIIGTLGLKFGFIVLLGGN